MGATVWCGCADYSAPVYVRIGRCINISEGQIHFRAFMVSVLNRLCAWVCMAYFCFSVEWKTCTCAPNRFLCRLNAANRAPDSRIACIATHLFYISTTT